MKQTKFSLIDLNDPKKTAAFSLLLLAFLAFIWELFSAFRSTEQINTAEKSLLKLASQEVILPNSPLFTNSLFGDYVPANLSEADIKQSMLDVQVIGVMFAPKEKDSQVILRVGGSKEESYLVGDNLPGGIIIKRISPQGIVVLHNGVLESLSLPKNELIFDVPAKPLMKE